MSGAELAGLAAVDISLPVALGLAAAVYLALLFPFPEPRHVFGPRGPWLVPCRDEVH